MSSRDKEKGKRKKAKGERQQRIYRRDAENAKERREETQGQEESARDKEGGFESRPYTNQSRGGKEPAGMPALHGKVKRRRAAALHTRIKLLPPRRRGVCARR